MHLVVILAIVLMSFAGIAKGYYGVVHRKEINVPVNLFISVIMIMTGMTGLVAAILFSLGYGVWEH